MMALHIDSFAASPPERSADPSLDQAMLRAYSVERAVDYGCALEDVLKLRRRVEAGFGWSAVALQLADDNERRGERAMQGGQPGVAARHFFHAAACCRLAQAGLEHDVASRVQAYERQARHFRKAAGCSPEPHMEYLEVQHQGAPHTAWLTRAPGLEAGGAAVVVWGGADGWCEAFHGSVPFFLERGLSVLLMELPGQGLARWRHGSLLRPDFTQAVSAALDLLVAQGADPARLGVVGHSAGGTLALAAAAADPRIRACCTNGGSVNLQQGLLNFPRVLQRFGRMMGEHTTEAEVLACLAQIDAQSAARAMRAAVLCLHGGQDQLVSDDEAQLLVSIRGAHAATLQRWAEGSHCVYNHAHERNCVMTDWFAHQLTGGRAATLQPSRSHP